MRRPKAVGSDGAVSGTHMLVPEVEDARVEEDVELAEVEEELDDVEELADVDDDALVEELADVEDDALVDEELEEDELDVFA